MELLNKLYSIHSMSGQEDAMRKFIKKHVKGLPGEISVRQDHGNLYITKGQADDYACLVAHLDQVQTKHSRDFDTFERDGCIFGFSYENRRLEGLGADDKNGIWIALKCLEELPALKIAFFKEEEVGCGGSDVADMAFFKDCRYCLQADRKNGGDLITDICGKICSDAFVQDLGPLMERYGYKKTTGLMTDVETLVNNGVGISCVNLSCGYYDPHTDHEFTDKAELYNALAFVREIVTTLTSVYPHTPPVRPLYTYQSYSYRYGGSYAYGGSSAGRLDRWDGDDCDPVIFSLSDYDSPERWMEDLIYHNYDADQEFIYPFVSADWEDTLGLDEDDFIRTWNNYAYGVDCWDDEEDGDLPELAIAG